MLGYTVKDLGSGYDPSVDLDASVLPDVAVCTPERLDALLRVSASSSSAGAEAADLLASSHVLVFDELQLLGRPGRGPRFELILTRLRMKYPNLEILGLSAASQGADDVARWLSGRDAIAGAKRPTGTLEIVWETGGTLRQRVANRVTAVGTIPRTTKAANDAAKLILDLNARYRPVLAVETSRPQAEALARRLVEQGAAVGAEWRASLTDAQARELALAIEEVKALLGDQHPLAQYMNQGIAFHHAGVPTHALQQIERLAGARLLRVVCATTTVAEGADLPFRAVVIPHLNFPGQSGRLDRDLYMNIIGRAGRAKVSVEGMVFLLDSSAPTLRQLVRASLWSDTTADRIRGHLTDAGTTVSTIEEWSNYNDVQSQVMGWLGDGDSYVDDQAGTLAAGTFTYQFGDAVERSRVTEVIADALQDLENHGLALAASPYRLTARGLGARLAGLAVPSVLRLEQAIERSRDGWLRDLLGVVALTPDLTEQIARLLFESIEVVQHSLWLRRNARDESAKLQALYAFGIENADAFERSEEYESDVALLAGWMAGTSYMDLAEIAPVYKHKASLFGGNDEAKRTSDATEYIGKLTYPASWTWSGAKVLAGELGEALPSFVRQSIEVGVPTEGAAELAQRASLTRPAAITVTEAAGPSWREVEEWLSSDEAASFAGLGLTQADAARLDTLRERLLADNEDQG